jgi:hypothetical protein
MISVWGVDHGDVVSKSAMVHLPGEKPPALVGKIVSHQGKRTTWGRTGPRKKPGYYKEQAKQKTRNPVADDRGVAQGRYRWKRVARNTAIGGGVGGAVGVRQSQYNSTHKKKLKSTPGAAASLGAYGAVPAALSGHYAAAGVTGGIAAGSMAGGYLAGRKAGDAYYAHKKKRS